MKHQRNAFFFILVAGMLVLSFFIASGISAEPIDHANLVPNGHFAEGNIGSVPDGWSVIEPNPSLAPAFKLMDGEHGRKFFMAEGNGRDNCYGYAKVPLTFSPGKTYQFQVRFQVEGIEDVNRHLIHGIFGDFNNGIFQYHKDGDWIVGEQTFTAKGEKAEIRLIFRFSSHGKVRWDEIRLTECAPVVPRPVKIAVSHKQRSPEGWQEFLDIAGKKKCDIALLGEYFVDGVHKPDGPALMLLAEKAKQWNMYVCGTLRLKRGDVTYNSAPLFDRQGQLLGIYDKVNLFDPELDEGISPGESVPVFQTDIGTVGIMICYDSWHPAVAKLLALKGAEVILFPNWGYYAELMPARSSDNGVVVAVTSCDGPCGVWDAGGNRAGEAEPDKTRFAPNQIIAFEEDKEKNMQFITVDLSIDASPHYWGGPLRSAPGGRRVRATGNFYLEDEISQEVRRWETLPTPP